MLDSLTKKKGVAVRLSSDWLSWIVYRSVAQRRYGLGQRVPPNWNSRVGCSPAGMEKENLWRREVKKTNNSILASCSPRHTRFPKDAQYNKSETLGLSLKKVCRMLIFPRFSSLAASGHLQVDLYIQCGEIYLRSCFQKALFQPHWRACEDESDIEISQNFPKGNKWELVLRFTVSVHNPCALRSQIVGWWKRP